MFGWNLFEVLAFETGNPAAPVWIPHSYPGCNQHAPNEHVLAPLMREGLAIMTGIFWDVGERSDARRRRWRGRRRPRSLTGSPTS